MFADNQIQKFYYSTPKLLKSFTIFVLIAGLGLYGLHDRQAPPHIVLGGWISLIVGALLGAMTLRRLLTQAPAVVLSSQGVQTPSVAELVPWNAITKLSEASYRRTTTLTLAVDPARARSVPRPWYSLQRGGKLALIIPISQIDTAGMDIAQLCRTYMAAQPAAPNAVPEEAGRSLPPPLTRPYVTYGLIALLVAIYCAELTFAVSPNQGGSPSVQTLVVLGGMFQSLIWQGQWWRLVTATLMHASIAHLLGNSFALWRAGVLLEGLVGRLWFLALFALCAIGGELASLYMTPPNIVGVGASGGIVGLFSVAIVLSFHFRSSAERNQMQVRALSILIPAVLPLFSDSGEGLRIDYSAHIGGAIVGAVLALALMSFWSRDHVRPPYARAAGVFAAAFTLVAAGALLPITQTYAAYPRENPFSAFFSSRYGDAARLFQQLSKMPDAQVAYDDLWRIMAMGYAKDPELQAQAQQAQAKLTPD
ncbi:rhomboid family protein, partial [Labrys miyagiensis]|uniref:rhomboid family protein n=1 Tax=Labrys miyagiensis TaxID=346912 RepID=UPI0024E0BA46